MDNDKDIINDSDKCDQKEEKRDDDIILEDFKFSGEISIGSSELHEELEYVDETADETVQGLVFVFTGDGKGKTTAALGMALRAAGWNKPLIFIQMMKKRPYGELHAFDMLDEKFEIYQLGREQHVEKGNPTAEDIELAERAIKMARESIESRQYDWIFIDEAITAVEYGLIKEQALLDLIEEKPDYLNLVFTGRGASQSLIDAADCVTSCEKIKHHYDKGIKAQKAVEY